MPTDAHFPFEKSSSGDVKTVDGDEFYYNHALQLGLAVAHENRATQATANDQVELESSLRSTFLASPYFDAPLTVELIEADGEELRATVNPGNASQFEIPLDEPDV